MTYRDNVEHAASALTRGEAAQQSADEAKWTLARLTYENTLMAGRVQAQEDRVPMAQWCADVQAVALLPFSEGTGHRFKRMWSDYGLSGGRDHTSWTDAYFEMRGESADEMLDRRAPQIVAAASPETRLEIFADLTMDPNVVAEVAAVNTPTSRAVSELEHRASLARAREHEISLVRDPIAKRLDEGQASAELLSLCIQHARASERFAEQIAELLPRSGTLGADRVFWIQQAVDRLRSVLDQLDTYLGTGKTDLDAFVHGVLSGE